MTNNELENEELYDYQVRDRKIEWQTVAVNLAYSDIVAIRTKRQADDVRFARREGAHYRFQPVSNR